MQFSVFVNLQARAGQDYNAVYRGRLAEAEIADRLGFHGVFYAEHAFCEHGRPSPVVTLANIAARTKRVRIGTAVSVLPWHNPLETAQDYATLDILSDGRLEFGVGRGAFKIEFDGYGLDWEESQPRHEECLEIILKAWTGKPFSYQGKYYQVPELAVNPVPVQRPHPPLWTPTLTAETMARAVNRGITPMVGASFSPLASVKKNFGYLDDAMRAADRHDMRHCAHPLIIVGDTTEGVRKQVRHAIEWLITDFADMFTLRPGEVYPPRFKFQEQLAAYIRSLTFERVVNEDLMWIGDANYVADRLKWLRDECKVDYILSNMSPGGLEHEIVAKSMELLATKVMPQVG